MDISGSYTLNAPREQVWDALFDPHTLKRAVPGCESLNRVGDNEYTARLAVEAAGIKGIYDATLKALDPQKPESLRLIVDGAGARGILHGDGTLRLEARGADATVVHYAGHAQLGGKIASIGMAVASHEATRLINECFARLANMISAVPVAASSTASVTAASAATSSATSAVAAPTAATAAPTAAALPTPPTPPTPASDALATPAAPHLETPLPRTAPIVPAHANRVDTVTPAAPAEAAAPAAPAPAIAPVAQDHQQPSGLVHWLRRLLRLE